MHSSQSSSRLLAIAAVLVVIALVGCGISAQSPQPGQSAAPSSAATAPPVATTAPGTSSTTAAPGSVVPVASATAAATAPPPATPRATPAGQVVFGNWPLYIDINDVTGGRPTLDKFTAQTGIKVTYQEDINDNEEFFGKIQPDLAAGNPTGYDIIVMTDWMIERMVRLGYLEPLDHSQLPNFAANAQPLYTNPWYDPGNVHSLPWQSGITGIAYNPKLTGREITSFDDLLDPAFAGRVGMFSEMRDTMSLTLLSMGVKPQDATLADVQAAHDKLIGPARAGQFRAFYGNDYYDALAAGDLAISMAWSGDISQMQLYDNPDVKFIVPDTGGMLWVDNMAIPNAAAHPIDAHALMNFYYGLDNATPLTEYIGYFSPVVGVQQQVLVDAAAARSAGHPTRADHLQAISQSAFPDSAQLQNVYTYKILTEDEERQWNNLFNDIVNG